MEECGIISVANDHIELRWDPATSLMQMRFTAEGFAITSEDGVWFLQQTERFTRGRAARIGILVDCWGLENTEAGWRGIVADFFRDPTFRPCVAWFNTSRLIQVTVEMFAVATPGIDGKAFASESDARVWLREQGI